MTEIRLLLLAALLLLPQLGSAQIFKSVDENGNVTFSDTPPKNGPSEEVKLRVTNSTPPPVVEAPQEAAPAEDEASAISYNVSISSPQNETTIAMGPGNFSVSATVEPALARGELLQLFIDGSPEGDPQSSTTWALTNVFRGAHDLSVVILDESGEQLAESESVRVYVLRPSVNAANRQRPTPR